MSDYGEVSYAVISDGDRHVITDAAIPLALELKSIIGSDHNWREMDSIPSYLGELDTEPRNEAVLVGAIVGAAVFFTSWVATKFLDEIYSMKFREPLRKALLAADQKFTGESEKELDELIEAALGSCINAIRYCGTDEQTLERFRGEGMPELCDALPEAKLDTGAPSDLPKSFWDRFCLLFSR